MYQNNRSQAHNFKIYLLIQYLFTFKNKHIITKIKNTSLICNIFELVSGTPCVIKIEKTVKIRVFSNFGTDTGPET